MFNCIVFGGSGSVGQELVHKIAASSKWAHVILVLRQVIPEHEAYREDPRFMFFITQNIMDFDTLQAEFIKNLPIHAIFNLIGGEIGQDAEFLQKIEVDWCIEILHLAQRLKCEIYSRILSRYLKKGRLVKVFHLQAVFLEKIQNEQLPNITIMKPGVLLGRKHNPKFGFECLAAIFCMKRIKCSKVAEIQLFEAEKALERNEKKGLVVYEHDDMLRLVNASD